MKIEFLSYFYQTIEHVELINTNYISRTNWNLFQKLRRVPIYDHIMHCGQKYVLRPSCESNIVFECYEHEFSSLPAMNTYKITK